MTKKDYELIARCISEISDINTRTAFARRLGAELLVTNKAFNLRRFLQACRLPITDYVERASRTDDLWKEPSK